MANRSLQRLGIRTYERFMSRIDFRESEFWVFDLDNDVYVPIDDIDSDTDLPPNCDAMYQAVDAILPNGLTLDGYTIVDRPWLLGLYVNEEEYSLHQATPDFAEQTAAKLSGLLGIPRSGMFPIQIRSRSVRKHGTRFESTFDLPSTSFSPK